MAAGSSLRADDPAVTPPPGYKVVYRDMGGGKKSPIFVKDQFDPLRHANIGDDPLDHQKVFSETNAMAGKTFLPSTTNVMDKVSNGSHQTFDTKVYDTSGSSNVYNLGSKATYHTASYDGLKTAPGYGQSFATKSASPEFQQAAAAFAPMGASEQNRTAPIDAKTYATFASPDQDKDFNGPEKDALHKRLNKQQTPIDGNLTIVDQIPDRPLSVDEVRNLLNHDFKPDLAQPAAPASKPMNDPDYRPEPLRIEPTSADDAPPAAGSNRKVDDDDANDPVPSPGTMAEPLPSK